MATGSCDVISSKQSIHVKFITNDIDYQYQNCQFHIANERPNNRSRQPGSELEHTLLKFSASEGDETLVIKLSRKVTGEEQTEQVH